VIALYVGVYGVGIDRVDPDPARILQPLRLLADVGPGRGPVLLVGLAQRDVLARLLVESGREVDTGVADDRAVRVVLESLDRVVVVVGGVVDGGVLVAQTGRALVVGGLGLVL
jgi:hypothetical protein